MHAELLPPGEASIPDDEIVLDNNETLDLSEGLQDVPETTETIGGIEVDLSQEVKLISDNVGEPITIENTALTNVLVEIPDQTTISAPSSWDGEITPPKTSSGGGAVPGNFLTPSSSILVGSPDVVLLFDNPVTLLLNGTTGQIAYKIPNNSTWNLISGCTGTFTNPNNPPEPGECSISNGVNTKVVTYHFTEFAGLSTPTPTSTVKSGGSGETGVGSPRVFGPGSVSSGSSGGGYYTPGAIKQTTFPAWFDNVTDWYREGKISAMEFLNAYQWVVENILK